MSDRRAAVRAAAALALCLSSGTASAESGCSGLTAHFQICPAETPWATAERVQFGDGTALEGDDLWLEFTESWATRREGDTLEAALEALVARITAHARAEQFDDFEILLTDRLETATLEVARAVYLIEVAPNEPVVMAAMIAEGGGQRVMLLVGHTEVVDTNQIDRTARELAALIRPARES